MHRILERQLRRFLGDSEPLDDRCQAFLEIISQTYQAFDDDRLLNERSLDLSSRELQEANRHLQEEKWTMEGERDRAKAIIASIGEGLIVVDQDFRVVVINPVAAQLLGVREEEVRGKKFFDISKVVQADETLVQDEQLMIDTLQNGEVAEIGLEDNVYLESRSGHRFPVSASFTPLLHGEEVTGAVLVFRDITEDREAAQLIEKEVIVRTREAQEERVRLVSSIQGLRLGFILTDHRRKALLVNDMAKKMLSIEQSDGRESVEVLSELLPGSEGFDALMDRAFSHRESVELGNAIWNDCFYHMYFSPVVMDDEVIGCVIMLEDITEAKELERSRDEFFSIASHELRTPLTVIRGNASLILEHQNNVLPADVLMEMVSDIHTASVRLIGIVNDFLDTSKLEQGRMVLDIQPFDVVKMADRIVKQMRTGLSQDGKVELAVEVPDGDLPVAKGDPGRVEQVILNLVGNALKFTQTGQVTIRLEPAADRAMVVVMVEDTGGGIPPEKHSLLFRKFQQAGGIGKSKGTGLGLYISRLLIEQMGGELDLARSEVGVGSVFRFTLPMADAADQVS